ncbi:DinB family protein [Actinoplanes couchii]|uniref:Mini-circle protein n=1 Tax=Actinoplanes couchii TaxID=403638 RepID=A0ABQ3XAJ8_9ACTN|nr:DinB family protein [Actinoplanes couchii]MDR6324837.1 hypothetical protein [Actinoplanes couchii]GID55541.1 mini-circle protein [Actinoplanes couchii]
MTRRRTKDLGPSWTAPGEKATLLGVLDHLRESIIGKVDGVPEPQIRAGGVPSGTNLLGLIKHLTYVERFYFLSEPIENLRATMRPARNETAEDLLTRYRETTALVNAVVDACPDLGGPAPKVPGRGLAPTMRWALTHMIEETARHAGHADIIREQLDGLTGR